MAGSYEKMMMMVGRHFDDVRDVVALIILS
jgi:hypothetical protein